MSIILENGHSPGYKARINKEGSLATVSEVHDVQFHNSFKTQQVYQVIGETTIANATKNVLIVTNTSETKLLAITFIRIQALDHTGGTAIPSTNSYWQIGLGQEYSADGAAVKPVNANATSGNVSATTAYDDNPTLTGTFSEIDKFYSVASEDVHKFEKRGSIILGTNDAITIRYTSDHTAGQAYCRVTFFMFDKDI